MMYCIVYPYVGSVCPAFLVLVHELHPPQSIHGLDKADVLLELHKHIKLDILPVVERLQRPFLGQSAHDLFSEGV